MIRPFFSEYTHPWGNASTQPLAQSAAPVAFAQPGQFANALASTYGAQSQGLGALGGAVGNAYSGYASGMGNVASAMANESSSRYSANAMAEAARQAAAGNIGSAALGAYGSAANSALNAWGLNQTSYNKALADMAMANQTALSNYGVGRNQALGALGNAYGAAGVGISAANALSDLDVSAGYGGDGGGYPAPGGGFTATGPDGDIASGSFGSQPSTPGLGQFYLRAKKTKDGRGSEKYADTTFAGLRGLQGSLMASDVSDSLNRNYADGMGRLDRQHYSSRSQPSAMLSQTLDGLGALSSQSYGGLGGGINQFYGLQNDPANRADFSSVLSGLSGGLQGAYSQIGSLAGGINAGARSALDGLNSFFNQSASQTSDLMDLFRGKTTAKDVQRTYDARALHKKLYNSRRL